MTTRDWLLMGTFVGEAIGWLPAYFLIIRHGFKDKTYGMPVIALCGNITWEYLFGFGGFIWNNRFHACPSPLLWADCPNWLVQGGTMAAALLDTVILYTVLRYGAAQFSKNPWIQRNFTAIVLFGLVSGLALVFTFENEVFTWLNLPGGNGFMRGDQQGGVYSGYALALLMGPLFMHMYLTRQSMSGQSIYIAIGMGFGNFWAYIYNVLLFQGDLPEVVHVLTLLTLIFNAAYVLLIYRESRAHGINPWVNV